MDLIDQDYLDKLSQEELDWLNKFNKEYVSDSLDRENLKNNLHNTKKLKKDCGDRNNARNRDILTREKAAKTIVDYDHLRQDEAGHGQKRYHLLPDRVRYLEHSQEERLAIDDYEDKLIDELDKKEIREAIDWLAQEIDKDEIELEEKLINEIRDSSESLKKKRSKRQ